VEAESESLALVVVQKREMSDYAIRMSDQRNCERKMNIQICKLRSTDDGRPWNLDECSALRSGRAHDITALRSQIYDHIQYAIITTTYVLTS
jgi:hypothetical protein